MNFPRSDLIFGLHSFLRSAFVSSRLSDPACARLFLLSVSSVAFLCSIPYHEDERQASSVLESRRSDQPYVEVTVRRKENLRHIHFAFLDANLVDDVLHEKTIFRTFLTAFSCAYHRIFAFCCLNYSHKTFSTFSTRRICSAAARSRI